MRKRSYTRNVGVMITEDCYEQLINITDEMEITISEYLRKLINQNLKEKQQEENCNE